MNYENNLINNGWIELAPRLRVGIAKFWIEDEEVGQ